MDFFADTSAVPELKSLQFCLDSAWDKSGQTCPYILHDKMPDFLDDSAQQY